MQAYRGFESLPLRHIGQLPARFFPVRIELLAVLIARSVGGKSVEALSILLSPSIGHVIISRPFSRSGVGRIALKVVDHFGDKEMKVLGV